MTDSPDIQTNAPPAGDIGIRTQEYNPELLLLIDGDQLGARYMNTKDRRSPIGGPAEITVRLEPITTSGEPGIQRVIPQSVKLYMTWDEFYKKIDGQLIVDLRDECKPPRLREIEAADRAAGVPPIGTQIGNSFYVGRSPETGEVMLLSTYTEPRRSFNGAAKHGKDLTEQHTRLTGGSYGVATQREWDTMIYNTQFYGHLGFAGPADYRDKPLWTATSQSVFNGWAVRPNHHQTDRDVRTPKVKSLEYRLIRRVPAENVQMLMKANSAPNIKFVKPGTIDLVLISTPKGTYTSQTPESPVDKSPV